MSEAKKPDVQIQPSQITIDNSGKVVIDNPEFSRLLSKTLSDPETRGVAHPLGFIQINLIC